MGNWDFTSVWLQVSGVIVPAPVADFLLSYLQWVSDGSVGDFQVGPPCGWDPADLCTLVFLVANNEVSSAQQLMDSLPSPPRVMLPSSTLIVANDNHLKQNPFRRRRSRKNNKLKVEADACIANQHLVMGYGENSNNHLDCIYRQYLYESMQTRKSCSKWQLFSGLKAGGGLENQDSDEDFVKPTRSQVKRRCRKARKRKFTEDVAGTGDGEVQSNWKQDQVSVAASAEAGKLGINTCVDQVAETENDHCRDNLSVKSGLTFLRNIDKHFMSSPRIIVRGRYRGQGMELIVRRRPEGTYVDWALFNTKSKKQALLVHGEMNYPFKWSEDALRHPEKFGKPVMGGWQWQGWGYGYLNLNRIAESFPQDPTVLHVDIEEAVFGGEEIFHHLHVSGSDCINVDHREDVNCQEVGCGVVIWRIKFTTFTTVEDESNKLATMGLAPATFRKDKEKQILHLSLVAFFKGETKIALHRDKQIMGSYEENVWLTKDGVAEDSVAAVDRMKLSRAQLIWETWPRAKKAVCEGGTLASKVNFVSRCFWLF